jgi:hypothetical protein
MEALLIEKIQGILSAAEETRYGHDDDLNDTQEKVFNHEYALQELMVLFDAENLKMSPDAAHIMRKEVDNFFRAKQMTKAFISVSYSADPEQMEKYSMRDRQKIVQEALTKTVAANLVGRFTPELRPSLFPGNADYFYELFVCRRTEMLALVSAIVCELSDEQIEYVRKNSGKP